MSETTLIGEPTAPQSDVVVDLGTASEQTRGSTRPSIVFDGNPIWPLAFIYF